MFQPRCGYEEEPHNVLNINERPLNSDDREDRNYDCTSKISEQRSDKVKLSVKTYNDTKLDTKVQPAKDRNEIVGEEGEIEDEVETQMKRKKCRVQKTKYY